MTDFTIIFDMDGVIFDTEKIWVDKILLINKKNNINLDKNFLVSNCGRSEEETARQIEKLYPGLDGRKIRNEWKKLVDDETKANGPQLKKDFKPLLAFLQKQKIPLGLATGSTLEQTKRYFNLAGLEIEKIFKGVVTIEDVKKGKPDPEIYKIAVQRVDAMLQNCIAIEDSPNGAMAAYNAGCKVILVPDVYKPTQQTKELCIAVLPNLSQVQKYLQNLLETN